MNTKTTKLIRFSITFIIVLIALILGFFLWQKYINSPWTRDGRIRADISLVSPEINGFISKLYVKDNDFVKKGQILFDIDSSKYEKSLLRVENIVKIAKDEYMLSKKSYLQHKISKVQLDLFKAKYDDTLSRLDFAKMNLKATKVYASSDGWVTNLALKEGDYLRIGDNKMAIIDANSFWVYGYFEENKIPSIKKGTKAIIIPLGTSFKIQGHVQSIARGISDKDNSPTDGKLLANVNPSFPWVRLAQRIPVRIKIDKVPKGFILRAGTTCTITLK